jgi:putative DNA primase/helicase
MQLNTHPFDNANPTSSFPAIDNNTFPSSPADTLEPISAHTVKALLSSSSTDETPDTSSHHKNSTAISDSTNIPTSPPAQPEQLFKTRSRARHSQQFSDTANSHRFVSQHRAHLRYIPQSNLWMLWDGQRWSPDIHNNIHTLARTTIQSFRDEALTLPYEQRELSEQLFDHADRSDSPKRLAAMLALASHDPALIASPQTFDSDPFLLNVLNGTINLRTGQLPTLKPHDPQDFITHLAPVVYDPSACSPVWNKFLSDITNHDSDLQHYLQSAVGYSLTGSIQEQVIFLLQGPGCNGKSTFLNAISSILGDYAQYSSCDLITSKSTSASPASIPSSLQPARLVIVPGIGSDRILNTLAIESITGGEIISTASTTHLSSPRFPLHCFKLWLATNQLPSVRNHSAGTWRRIKLLHFPVSFLRREDKNLASKLQSCAPAILNWAIQGCLTWQREGLLEPACVQLTTSGYQDEQDQLASFFQTCCQFGPQCSVKAGELYKAYQLWCKFIGDNQPLAAQLFGRHISAHGYPRIHKKTGNVYLGISLVAPLNSVLSPEAVHSKTMHPLSSAATPDGEEGEGGEG